MTGTAGTVSEVKDDTGLLSNGCNSTPSSALMVFKGLLSSSFVSSSFLLEELEGGEGLRVLFILKGTGDGLVQVMNLHRQILAQTDLNGFLASESFSKIETFLLELNESVKGKERIPIDTDTEALAGQSHLIIWLSKLFKRADELIDEFPPQNRNADVNRFGNVAFREWLFKLQDEIIPDSIPVEFSNKSELEGYLINSFGSSQRIDYGTGHELHFLIFLMGLNACKEDYSNLVLKVFSDYIKLMRKLQKTYWLEPAGSHGVWGLDDYHFLPFLFGSAQLCGHENIRPRAVHSAEMVYYLAPKYIYFDSILNILEIKTSTTAPASDDPVLSDAPGTNALRWMSPVLDDISIVKTWEKVNSGLIKMWKVEVMSKLPIMQHLLFGESILAFKRREGNDEASDDDSGLGHYTHSMRGDCCGNPLPSIYAAMNESSSPSSSSSANGATKQPGLPFD